MASGLRHALPGRCYDGQNIHPNNNGWIQNLDQAMRVQLSNM